MRGTTTLRSRSSTKRRPNYTASEAAILIAVSDEDAAPPTAPKVDRLPTSLSGPNAKASVTASFAITSRMRAGDPHVLAMVTVVAAGGREVAPALQVHRLSIYEKGTNKKIAEIMEPVIRGFDTHRATRKNTYSFDVPPRSGVPSLEPTKKYAVVAEVVLNSGGAQSLRSDFGAVVIV
jgi:hypothetical protein